MYEPTRILTKVTAAAVAGAIVTILVWVLSTYAHVDLPETVVAAITTIISALVAFVTPLLPGEVRQIPTDMPHDAIEALPEITTDLVVEERLSPPLDAPRDPEHGGL